MRTTITLEPDVAAELDRRRRRRGTSLKQEVNELLRAGMASEEGAAARATSVYRSSPLSAGRCLVGSLDDVAEALAIAEGEDFP